MVITPGGARGDLSQSWQSGILPVSGGHLAYHRTGGTGPALVLSHGLTDNGLCWSRVAAALQSQFDVIMLDARGHGQSSRMPVGEPHFPERDLAEAIAQLGLEAPLLMGHSVGARTTAAYAGSNPGRVSKIILEDPPLLPTLEPSARELRRQKFREQVGKFQSMTDAEITAIGKAQSPSWHADEFPAWTAAKKQVDPDAMPDYIAPWQDSLAGITAPTLLICGDSARGSMVSPEIAEEAMRINPNIRTAQIRDAGHNVRRENLHDFMLAVRSFLLER